MAYHLRAADASPAHRPLPKSDGVSRPEPGETAGPPTDRHRRHRGDVS